MTKEINREVNFAKRNFWEPEGLSLVSSNLNIPKAKGVIPNTLGLRVINGSKKPEVELEILEDDITDLQMFSYRRSQAYEPLRLYLLPSISNQDLERRKKPKSVKLKLKIVR